MKGKTIKNLEKLVIVLLAIFIIIGIMTNYKIIVELENLNKEVLISEKEKEYIQTTLYSEERDSKELKQKYLDVLKDFENKEPYDGLEEEKARVYYFLGYNEFLDKNYDEAKEFLEKAISIFDETKNYFYILNGNNVLINIDYETKDYINAVKRASKTYKVLQNPNIEGISKKGQEQLKANILSGLINTTAAIGMDGISKAYYDELVEITKDSFFENDLTLHAKYYYNLTYKDYEKAKENAVKFIEIINVFAKEQEYREEAVNSAHIYLLTVLAHQGVEEGFENTYLKVKNGYKKLDKNALEGNLKEIEAIYYKTKKDYKKAYEKYDEAIGYFEKANKLEQVYDMCLEVLNLNNKIDISIDEYIEKIESCKAVYNKETMVSELADAITKTSYEKNREDKYMLVTEAQTKEELISHSKNINIIYILIIIVLAVMARKLKEEIIRRETKEKELEDMINIDYLTKAASKQRIFNILNNYIKKNEKFSLIIFDLDNFKKINDSYGHTFGDEVLVKVVENIRKTISNKGIIGRFGGEEFIILINKDIEIKKLVDEIQSELSKVKYSIENLTVTVSGGAVIWNGETADELICLADMLLYEAKVNGKNKIIVRS